MKNTEDKSNFVCQCIQKNVNKYIIQMIYNTQELLIRFPSSSITLSYHFPCPIPLAGKVIQLSPGRQSSTPSDLQHVLTWVGPAQKILFHTVPRGQRSQGELLDSTWDTVTLDFGRKVVCLVLLMRTASHCLVWGPEHHHCLQSQTPSCSSGLLI